MSNSKVDFLSSVKLAKCNNKSIVIQSKIFPIVLSLLIGWPVSVLGNVQVSSQETDPYGNLRSGNYSTAYGWYNQATNESAIAIGYSNKAVDLHSAAIGNGNKANGVWATSIGTGNVAAWIEGVTLPEFDAFLNSPGVTNRIRLDDIRELFPARPANQALSIGINNGAFGEKSSAIGVRNLAVGQSSIAIGKSNFAYQSSSVALGNANTAYSNNSSAIGVQNIVGQSAEYGSAVGVFNYVEDKKSFAFGGFNKVANKYSSVFGFNNNIFNQGVIAVGALNSVRGESSIAFGAGNIISGRRSISIGSGMLSEGGNNLRVVGQSTVEGNYAISIGYENTIDSDLTIALGNYINSNHIQNSIILGNRSRGVEAQNTSVSQQVPFAGKNDLLEIGTYWSGRSLEANGNLSIGAPQKERQIKHVATGEISQSSTDAINGSQLYSVIRAIGDVPLYFSGDETANTVPKLLGNTLEIKGKADTDNLTESNIGVIAHDGALNIKLSRLINGLSSISFLGNTSIDNDGLTISTGPVFTRDRISANGLVISDVKTGNSLYDAANIQYVNNKFDLLQRGYTVINSDGTSFPLPIGSTIRIAEGENILTSFSNAGLSILLNKTITGLKKIQTHNGIVLDSNGLALDSESKFTNDGLYVGNNVILNRNGFKSGVLRIDAESRIISGVEDPRQDNDVVNLRFLNEKIQRIASSIKFIGNYGGPISSPLGGNFVIKGADTSKNISEFDGGKNIITHVESNSKGIQYTVALKKSPEFETLSLKGSQNGEKNSKLTLTDSVNSEKIVASVEDGYGKIAVLGENPQVHVSIEHNGISISDSNGYSKLVSSIDGRGDIYYPKANKRRFVHSYKDASGEFQNEEIATLNDGFIFSGNTQDKSATKLNSKVIIAGAEANTNWNDFDNGQNIMTKVETDSSGETIIRIAMRKNLKLKNGDIGGDGTKGELNIKQEDGSTGITLNPDKIIFNNISKLGENGQVQKSGSAGISMTQNGKSDLVNKGPATRIIITDSKGDLISEVATTNDGLKFGANTGDEVSNLLNSKVIVAGNKQNTDWTKFDEGKNIMTKVVQNKGNTDITIALKRDVELDSATFGHGATTEQNGVKPKEGKDGRIKLVNKNGKTTIQIDAGFNENQNGPSITVSNTKSVGGGLLYYLMV